MLTLAVLLIPVDIKLVLEVRAGLVARDDALPIVAIAPPIVSVTRQHRTVASYCIEADADL